METPTRNAAPHPRVQSFGIAGDDREPGADNGRLFDEHGLGAEVEGLFRRLIESSWRRPEDSPYRPSPSLLPIHLILGSERLRLLADDNAKVTVTVAMPDRHRFDDIEFPDQIETGCDRHGFRIKAFLDDDIQILAIHVERPLPVSRF
jgi:hypothetical protein